MAITPETREALNTWLKASPPHHLPLLSALPELRSTFSASPSEVEFDLETALRISLMAASLPLEFAGPGALRLLRHLHREFSDKLLALQSVAPAALEKSVCFGLQLPALKGDHLKIPAILRSVCEFLAEHPPLREWLASADSWEALLPTLAESIYYMGRTSEHRLKARRFFLLARILFGNRNPPGADAFLWPVAQGHFRFLREILKPKRIRIQDTGGAMRFFKEFGEAFQPGGAWLLYPALSRFLEAQAGATFAYRCQEDFGGCAACPWFSHCPIPNPHR